MQNVLSGADYSVQIGFPFLSNEKKLTLSPSGYARTDTTLRPKRTAKKREKKKCLDIFPLIFL